MKRLVLLIILFAAFLSGAAQEAQKKETKEQRDQRMEWWRDATFGMFIHWGLYAIPAGEYKGAPVDGIGEWIMENAKIPIPEYEKYATQFNPEIFNAKEWVAVAVHAGVQYIVITTKHHDGFCLWPSKYTEHSVKNSPFKKDVVKMVRESCNKFNLKFGVYPSPWDPNHPEYGREGYLTYYRNQLKEMFTNYGPVTEMWFDGANGGDGYYGGANETRRINGRTYYQWPATMDIVRKIEPGVIFFSDAGPGVRWVGNEKGIAG